MDANRADYYIEGIESSKFLLENMEGYFGFHANILEIGCNVGRNLNYLFQAGYQNLSGVEISNYATELLKKTYLKLECKATIYNSPVEEVITTLPENGYMIWFTQWQS
ncbi:hypothetical protein [Brevibacillus choshinensis]|uniref:hypothetical protein n=1 Tax=Brevibacillus choshinensis TaxID=54911 RepID=UPI002E24D932|nr:hypothetical protein [Brevibacillus choshinensis]MED4753936.1 hypothetical protein [Brevibacillus choshinensis]MED4779067.1 hypothetical protein [Brevibacillus choshinensis]